MCKEGHLRNVSLPNQGGIRAVVNRWSQSLFGGLGGDGGRGGGGVCPFDLHDIRTSKCLNLLDGRYIGS